MLYFICLMVGLGIGIFITLFFVALRISAITFGTLRTRYDDGQPYLFLDMDQHPSDLKYHKFVIFKVERSDSHD